MVLWWTYCSSYKIVSMRRRSGPTSQISSKGVHSFKIHLFCAVYKLHVCHCGLFLIVIATVKMTMTASHCGHGSMSSVARWPRSTGKSTANHCFFFYWLLGVAITLVSQTEAVVSCIAQLLNDTDVFSVVVTFTADDVDSFLPAKNHGMIQWFVPVGQTPSPPKIFHEQLQTGYCCQ